MNTEKNETVKYEDIVTTGLTEPLVDTGIDYAEMGIDTFMNNDVVKEIPIVKTIASLVKIGLSIKEWLFAKKFLKFIEKYNSGVLTEKEKEDFLDKYFNNSGYRKKIVTLLITSNDKYFETEQSKIAGNLFVAYIKGLISLEDYTIICGCLDNFQPFAAAFLDELEKEKEPYHRDYQGPIDPRAAVIQSCAFGYQWGTHFYVNPIGILVHQYGIKEDYTNTPDDLFKKAKYKVTEDINK